jgi:hypothetical protein
MNLELQLSSDELDTEDLQALTRQLCDSISDETDIPAEIPSGDVAKGSKGEPVTIGLIILKGIPAIVALCGVLKAYFSRQPSLSIEIVKPDGTKIKLEAKNIEEFEQLKNFLSL